MKQIILLTVALVAISLSSCSQEHDHDKEAIVLDNGAKWTVDGNMMVHIEKMANEVKANAAEANYNELNNNLLTGIDALTSDCTMKGQAHDELHKWLLPFIATANEYKSDMTGEQKHNWFSEVQDAFLEFNTYFN